jgi:hypothetical protein
VSEDMCVDVTPTEVSLDDFDACSLAIAVFSVDSQKRVEIFRDRTFIKFIAEFLK